MIALMATVTRYALCPLACLVFLHSGSADAACHPDGSVNIYNGTIGKSAVRLALQTKSGGIEGLYAYLLSTSDIALKGNIDSAGGHVTLTEFDAAGSPSSTFEGIFADRDARGSLNCEVISGKWIPKGKAPADFKLSMESSGATDLAHLYDAAGVTDDEIVNKAARAFRDAVARNRRESVAKMIVFPIQASVNRKRMKIANAQALIAHYNGVFTPAFRATISADFTRLMFARDQGVMMGGGEVWFNPDGKVIAINN
jgi:hypothetical protein